VQTEHSYLINGMLHHVIRKTEHRIYCSRVTYTTPT